MDLTKICTKCKQEKDINEFYKEQSHKNGLASHCKSCKKQYKIEHKDDLKISTDLYNFKNKEKYKQYNKKHKEEKKIYNQQYYILNKKEIRNKQRLYQNKRSNIDNNFKLIRNLRRRISLAIKNNQKSGHTLTLIMCSIPELKLYLESLWLPGMSWDNYGYGNDKWNIDHIIPCSFFNLQDSVEQYMCFRWQNLQPMWQKDNMKKSNNLHLI